MSVLSVHRDSRKRRMEYGHGVTRSSSSLCCMVASLEFLTTTLQSGASYLSQDFVRFFHVSCEGLPGQ